MDLMLRQDKYVLDILHQAGMSSYKPVDTLISTSKVTNVSGCLFFNPTCFQKIIGTLQYLTFTRLGIYFAINKVY